MEDISKTTVGVLLILVVLISVIGTWVVLSTITDIENPQRNIQKSSKNNLGFAVMPEPISTESQGNIQLTVLKPAEGGS